MSDMINIACPSSPWVPYYVPGKAYNGYTLFTPMGSSVVWLVDMQGHPVHCWQTPYSVTPYAVLLPNGNLLYCGTDSAGPESVPGGANKVLAEVDWDGNTVWEYRDTSQHHAFFRMDNGNTMILRKVNVPDDIAKKVKGGMPGTELNGAVRTDGFQEITPEGKVVWEWLGYKHLDTDVDVMCPFCPRADWTWINSCFVLPNGDVLTTMRHIDTLAIIDKKTGDIKWRWGVGVIAHPHDPTLLDNGNILVFDNGFHRREKIENYSRVVEVNPNTGEIEWEYRDRPQQRFYSFFACGCQRLPNGNTLICDSAHGRFLEVTLDNEKVWEYLNPFYLRGARPEEITFSNRVFRAYRYGPDYADLGQRELSPDRTELTLREIPAWQGKTAQQLHGR